MSAFAFEPLELDADGPDGGMSPPYQLSRDVFGFAHVAPPPFEYAELALLYPPWQPEQPPIVPDPM